MNSSWRAIDEWPATTEEDSGILFCYRYGSNKGVAEGKGRRRVTRVMTRKPGESSWVRIFLQRNIGWKFIGLGYND
jgi:hypothetical protein